MLDRRSGYRPCGSFAGAIEPLEARHMLAIVGLLGDIQGGTNANAVADVVKGWNPDYLVFAGDNYYEPDGVIDNTIGQYYHDYVSPYNGAWGAGSPSGNRAWSALGNHEYEHSAGAADYLSFFTFPGNERYYKQTIDNVDWFFVNSNPEEPDGNTIGSDQYDWLQAEMAASAAAWQFVVFHHAAYSSATSSDATNMRWPFKTWGADAVFAGHHHLYERLSVDGLPYFTSGLGGASIAAFGTTDPNSQFRYNSQHGALRLNIGTTSVTFDFFNRSGTLVDTSTIAQAGAPPAPSQLIAGAVSSSQVDLSWKDNSTGESNFILERSPDGVSNWTEVATPAANATSHSDTSAALLPGVTYHYRVRAAAAGGAQSANSNTASATTLQPGYVNWIPRGATWKYLDTGVSQGMTWRAAGFDDSTWSSGRGQLGYGDGDETTVVSFGPNSGAKYITTYFRKGFQVADPSQVIQLDLSLLRDDGAVVYLNGTEIWRNNMPAGTISFSTVASSPITSAQEPIWLGLSISPALLIAGNNVIAAEIHQDRGDSSDLSFDFVMTARLAAAIAPPSAFKAVAVAPNQVNLSWIDTVTGEDGFKIERSTDGISFAQIGTAAAGATAYADSTAVGGTTYWYRARSYNVSGDSRSSSVAMVTTPQPSTPPVAIMPPWSSDDVGAIAAGGSATHDNGLFTLHGSGAGVEAGAATDEFHFVWQAWNGSGTIIARVSGITNTNADAKAGIMFRETLATESRHVMMSYTAGGTISILGRGTATANSGPGVVTRPGPPIWLKLVRNGNVFTAFSSSDGVNWGSAIASTTISMTTALRVGLFVTSKNDGVVATGTFDSVSVTNATTLSQGTATSPPRSKAKWKTGKSLVEEAGLEKGTVDLLA